ncbi:PadR family transcriptional regulator, partial [Citrobacter sp. TBCS-11]
YYITDTGKQARKVFLAKWNILSLSVNDLINEKRSDL